MSVAAVTRQQYLDDVVNPVGVTFLANELRCAKCHDLRDPIPTKFLSDAGGVRLNKFYGA